MGAHLGGRCEYLTTAKTRPELEQEEMRMRVAGFKKRRGGHGFSPVTREFYQWWDREAPFVERRKADAPEVTEQHQ